MDEYSPESLSKDVAFDLMRSERRRQVVRLLVEGGDGDTWTLDALAGAIAERAGGGSQAAGDVDRIANELRHKHLPRLADAGVVTLGPEGRTVAATAAIDDLDPLA